MGPDSRSQKCRKTCFRILRNNVEAILPLIAVVLAFAVGLPLTKHHIHPVVLMWIQLPGELYIRGLFMLSLPLIIACAVTASASTDLKSQGKLGGVVLIYSCSHNLIGSGLGVGLSVAFKLGTQTSDSFAENATLAKLTPHDAFADLLRNLVPDNMVAAAFRSTQTRYEEEMKNGMAEMSRVVGLSTNPNIVGLLVLSVVLGMGASAVGKKAESFLNFFAGLQEVMLKVLIWFLKTTCVGVFSLVLGNLLKLDDPISSIYDLAFLIASMTVGCALMSVVVVPITIFVATRSNPFRYLPGMLQPWVISIGPPTSMGAYPAHLIAAEKWGLDMGKVSFALPLYILIDKPGSAMFIGMCTGMIANMSGGAPTPADYIVIFILTSFLMAAVPDMPSGSLVTILIVLSSVNLSARHIGLLFLVEWLLDRMRTGINTISQDGGIIFADGIIKGRTLNADTPTTDIEKADHEISPTIRSVGIGKADKEERQDLLVNGVSE